MAACITDDGDSDPTADRQRVQSAGRVVTARRKVTRTFGNAAVQLKAHGYQPVPIDLTHGKRPVDGLAWGSYELREGDTDLYYRNSVGLKGGDVVALDIDVRHEGLARSIEELAETMIGKAPRRIGMFPKVLRMYRADKSFEKISGRKWVMPGDDTSAGYKAHHVEILADGQQFVVYGTHKDTHQPYRWNGQGEPLTVPLSDLTVINEAQARAFVLAADNLIEAAGGKSKSVRIDFGGDNVQEPRRPESALIGPIEQLISALNAIPHNDDRDWWVRMGLAFHQGCGGDSREAREAWISWCLTYPKNDRAEALKRWKSFKDNKPTGKRLGAGTIIAEAQKHGWRWTQDGVLEVERISDVKAEPLDPLWPGCLYRGKITVFAGVPGDGKSLCSNNLAARISSGSAWPVGVGSFKAASVLMLTAEDDPSDTIKPRLDLAGANGNRIELIKGVRHENPKTKDRTLDLVSLINDLPKIEALIIQRSTLLFIIDPLTSFADSDTNKTQDMRRLLDGLAQMAIRTRVAVLIITHLNKRSDSSKAMHMIAGSHVIVAAVRIVFIVGRDPNDSERRLVLPVKMNIGPSNIGFAFRISPKRHPVCGEVPIVTWEKDIVHDITADDALIPATPRAQASAEKINEVCDWLRELLKAGPVLAHDLWAEAEERGYTKRRVHLALEIVNAKSEKQGYQGKWRYSLPSKNSTLGDT